MNVVSLKNLQQFHMTCFHMRSRSRHEAGKGEGSKIVKGLIYYAEEAFKEGNDQTYILARMT